MKKQISKTKCRMLEFAFASKKIVLAMILIGMVTASSFARNGLTCDSAKIFPAPNSIIDSNVVSGTEMWFSFVADSTHKRILMIKDPAATGHIHRMEVYSGTCSSPTLIDSISITLTNDSLLILNETSLTVSNTYHIKVVRGISTCSGCTGGTAKFKMQIMQPISFGMTCGAASCVEQLANPGQSTPTWPHALFDCGDVLTTCINTDLTFCHDVHNPNWTYPNMTTGDQYFEWAAPGASTYTTPTLGISTPYPGGSITDFSYDCYTFQWSSPGIYPVYLSYFDLTDPVNPLQITIEMHVIVEEIVPSLPISPNPVCVNEPVTFTNGATSLPSGNPISGFFVTLDYGDGSSLQPFIASPTLTHTYTTPGTYTVTMTINDYVCSNTSTYTVVVTDITADFTATEACEGTPTTFTDYSTCLGAGTITYLWDFGDGSTSTLQNPTYTYASAGTYTVTFTVTNVTTGGTSTISYNVTVAPPPFIFVLGATNACDVTASYSVIQVGVSLPVSSYSWTADNGAANPTGTGATFTPAFTGSGGTVTCTITTENGCTATASFYVGSCCRAPQGSTEHTFYGGNVNTDMIANIGPPFITGAGGVITNQTFYINGSFTVDHNLTLVGCTVLLGYNAALNLKPGVTLKITASSINQSHLYACEEMWQGINVYDATSHVIINEKSTIEDAEVAVFSALNGDIKTDGINASSTVIFNKNYQGIVINNCTGTFQGHVRATTFECNNGVIAGGNPTNTGNTLLHYPHAGERSYSGIEIARVDDIKIGDETSANFTNTFDYMDYGIRTMYSGSAGSPVGSVTIYNNKFKNIYDIGGSSKQVAAIWAYNDYYGPYGNLKVGADPLIASQTQAPNYFEECNYGVFSQSYSSRINYNTFKNINSNIEHQAGIFLGQNTKVTNEISWNNMIKMRYGIELFLIQYSKMDIHDNTIDVDAQLNMHTWDMHSFGICSFLSFYNKSDLFIRTNHITLRNIDNTNGAYAADGIRSTITQASTFYILGNEVHLYNDHSDQTVFSNGIRVDGFTNGGVVNCNLIDRTGTGVTIPGNNLESNGIYNENSTNMQFFNNNTSFMASGIRGTWDCPGFLTGCNYLGNSGDGVTFNNATNIPNQHPSAVGTGNMFAGTSYLGDIAGYAYTMGGGSTPIDWYWFSYNPITGANPTNINILPATSDGCAWPPGIAGCSIPEGGDHGGEKVAMREMLLGKIVRGENSYDSLSDEFMLRDSIFAFRQLRMADTLMHLQTDDDTLYQNFYARCKARNVGKFEKVNEYIIDSVFGHIDSAQITNQNIPTHGTMQDNQKLVNSIYLNKLKYESDTINKGVLYVFDSTETAELQSVAYQHPLLGGESVYLARILLWIEVVDDKTLIAKSLVHKPKPKATNPDSFKLFPNPNNGEMQLNYKLQDNESGYVILLNILGEKINTYPFAKDSNVLNITEKHLDNGVYFYQVFVNSQRVYSDKFIINK